MNFVRMFSMSLAAALCLCSGCSPTGSSRVDEEKEPHFVVGRSRVNALDYRGAIESFTEALEANPRSASAHFELGVLYAERESDPASAIHHYNQYLRLRPDAGNAEMVRQLVIRLKQELAQTVLPITTAAETQRQIQNLSDEILDLRAQLAEARGKLAERAAATNQSSIPSQGAARENAARNTRETTNRSRETETRNVSAASRPTARRTHVVKAGETPSAIAKQYSLKLETLLAANPGLNPRKMKVGQSLNIPAT